MLFNDRTALGKTLASHLRQYRSKDAIVFCIKQSSLLTCITMASELRGWVYPLLFYPVFHENDSRKLLGTYVVDGAFYIHPESDIPHNVKLPSKTQQYVDSQRPLAMSDFKQLSKQYGMELDKKVMNGRDVIIVGDIVIDPLPLTVASQQLLTIRPKSISVAIGNASPESASAARSIALNPVILDVISSRTVDDEHYFEHRDAYDDKQKYDMARLIKTYWK